MLSVSEIAYVRAQSYSHLAGAVLLLYDILLTLPDEIEFMWKKEFRLGFFLYIMTRYGFLVSLVFTVPYTLFVIEEKSTQLQNQLFLLFQSFSLLAVISIHSLLAGRAWAASHGNKWVVRGVIGLLVLYIVVSFLCMCIGSTSDVQVINSTLAAMQGWTDLLSDTSVIAIMTYYAWIDGMRLQELYRSKTKTLTHLFIRQGILRFLVVFIWVMEISLMDKLSDPLIGGIDTPLEDAVSSILICRFMLDLRKHNESPPILPSLALQDISIVSNHVSSCHSSWTFHGYFERVNNVILAEFGDNQIPYESDDSDLTAPPSSPSYDRRKICDSPA